MSKSRSDIKTQDYRKKDCILCVQLNTYNYT